MTGDPPDPERRHEPRLGIRIEVDYASENTFLFAYITDISSMGIFIRTDDPLDVGSELQLRFSPPAEVHDDAGSTPFELAGEVMWNTTDGGVPGNPGMGVRFLDLSQGARSRLMSLVRAITYLDDRSGN